MRAPTRLCTTGEINSTTAPGTTPRITHSAARANIAGSEKPSVSLPFSAALVRPAQESDRLGFTKHAAAGAAESASSAPTAGIRKRGPHCEICGLTRIAWNVSHSETKPLSGGSAEMATQPIRNATAVSACGG